MFEGQWNFGSIPLQDSREASETSQDGTFHLNRGEKADKTAGTKDRRNSAPASDSFINENEHYASIDIRSKRTLPELPAMAAAALQKLLAAVRILDIVEVSRLLKLGAPVNEPNPDIDALGMCCLHYAALRGRQHISDPVPEGVDDGPEGATRAAAMVAVLCDAGAEVNICDSMGFTALHLAASVGDDEVVAELLNRGAFLDVQDDEVNYTPMHAAAEAGQVGAMLLMIEAGAFIDKQVARAINEALGIRIRNGGQRTGVRSFASSAAQNQLVDSRDSSMLPNGGGRLSDLKDVTGKSIWDVMDGPATACGLLEVLIADVAHVDVIKARSLIELLQQTQVVRQLSHVMQRALAEEGKSAGVPWSVLMPQVDAIGEVIEKAMAACHTRSMDQAYNRTPSRIQGKARRLRDPPKPSPSMMTRDSSMMGSHRQSYRFPGFSSSRLSGASHFMPFTKDRTSPKAAKWQQALAAATSSLRPPASSYRSNKAQALAEGCESPASDLSAGMQWNPESLIDIVERNYVNPWAVQGLYTHEEEGDEGGLGGAEEPGSNKGPQGIGSEGIGREGEGRGGGLVLQAHLDGIWERTGSKRCSSSEEGGQEPYRPARSHRRVSLGAHRGAYPPVGNAMSNAARQGRSSRGSEDEDTAQCLQGGGIISPVCPASPLQGDDDSISSSGSIGLGPCQQKRVLPAVAASMIQQQPQAGGAAAGGHTHPALMAGTSRTPSHMPEQLLPHVLYPPPAGQRPKQLREGVRCASSLPIAPPPGLAGLEPESHTQEAGGAGLLDFWGGSVPLVDGPYKRFLLQRQRKQQGQERHSSTAGPVAEAEEMQEQQQQSQVRYSSPAGPVAEAEEIQEQQQQQQQQGQERHGSPAGPVAEAADMRSTAGPVAEAEGVQEPHRSGGGDLTVDSSHSTGLQNPSSNNATAAAVAPSSGQDRSSGGEQGGDGAVRSSPTAQGGGAAKEGSSLAAQTSGAKKSARFHADLIAPGGHSHQNHREGGGHGSDGEGRGILKTATRGSSVSTQEGGAAGAGDGLQGLSPTGKGGVTFKDEDGGERGECTKEGAERETMGAGDAGAGDGGKGSGDAGEVTPPGRSPHPSPFGRLPPLVVPGAPTASGGRMTFQQAARQNMNNDSHLMGSRQSRRYRTSMTSVTSSRHRHHSMRDRFGGEGEEEEEEEEEPPPPPRGVKLWSFSLQKTLDQCLNRVQVQVLRLEGYVEDLMVMGRGVPNAELPQLTPKDGTFASTPLVRNHTLSFSNARTAHGGHFKAEHKGMDDSGGLRKLVALEENVATGELKSPEADRGMEKTRPANGNVHGIPHASFTHGDESDSSSSSENEMGAADKALSMDGKGGVLTASKSGPSMISLLKPNKPDAGISLAWDLIDQAVALSDELLVHLLVDRLVRMFPQALLRTPWSTVMINLGQSFPGAFHLLLACLQDVDVSVLEAFVDGFNLEELNSKISALQSQGIQDREQSTAQDSPSKPIPPNSINTSRATNSSKGEGKQLEGKKSSGKDSSKASSHQQSGGPSASSIGSRRSKAGLSAWQAVKTLSKRASAGRDHAVTGLKRQASSWGLGGAVPLQEQQQQQQQQQRQQHLPAGSDPVKNTARSYWHSFSLKSLKGNVLASELSMAKPSHGLSLGRTPAQTDLRKPGPAVTRINSVFDAARALRALRAKPLDTYNTHAEDAASFKYTLYKQLVAGLEAVPYKVMKAFVERLDPAIMCEMAMMSVFKDFVLLLPGKIVTYQSGHDTIEDNTSHSQKINSSYFDEELDRSTSMNFGLSDPGVDGSINENGSKAMKSMESVRQSVQEARRVGRELRKSLNRSGNRGGNAKTMTNSEARVEVLNISRLLSAALTAQSAESVEAGVSAMVRWVEVNGAQKRTCFLDGLRCDIIEELASNFPTAASNLLNIAPQASRDVQVSSMLLGKEPVIYRCSKTRYSFMWRQADLKALFDRGFKLEEVEMLADHSMRFRYICRAASQGTTVDELLELMDMGLSGKHIADLVSSGAQLSRVRNALEMGIPAELVASMLENKLSFQIIDILLTHPVQRTTVEDRGLLLELLQSQVDMFSINNTNSKQQFTLGYQFVARFLEKWAALNWDKSYLDKVFHISDTLTTKLKTAHDFKLTMRTQYQHTNPIKGKEPTNFFDWAQILTIGSVYMQPGWLVTRFITLVVFLALLGIVELAHGLLLYGSNMLPQHKVSRLMRNYGRASKEDPQRDGGGEGPQQPNPLHDGRPDLPTGGGLPPGVQLPGFGGGARPMRGRGQRPPPPPRPPRVPWWRKLMPKNKVAPKEKDDKKEDETKGAKERTMDATAKVLPLLHIGALGRQSIIVGLVKADVPASWYVTPVVRAIVSIQWASFAKVLMALHLLEHLLLMCMYGAFLLLIHRSFRHETAQLREEVSRAGNLDDDEHMRLLLGHSPVDQHAVLNTIGGGVVMAGLALFTISMLVTRAKQLHVSGIRMWAGNLVNLVDMVSGILIIAIFVAFAVPASYTVVLSMGALEVLVLFMRLLFFSAIAERMGSLVRTVIETVKDVRFFFILLGILYGGFAIAFNMQLGGDSDESQPTAVYLFTTMVGDFSSSFVLDVLQDEGQWLVPELAAFLWCVYGFFMSVVLLTLLVAIMNDTYTRIRDAEEAEVLRLKARLIADLQSLLSPEATQLIQDKTLGPFLHQLTPVLGDHLGASKAQADQENQLWQMRLMVRSEVRNALMSLSKQGILGNPHTAMGTTTTSFAPTSYAPSASAGPTPSPSGRMGLSDVVREASMIAKQYNKSAANSMSYQPSEGSRHPRAEIDVSELHEDLRELKEMVKGMQASMQRAPNTNIEASLHRQGSGVQDPRSRSWKRDHEAGSFSPGELGVGAPGFGRLQAFGNGRNGAPMLEALIEDEQEGGAGGEGREAGPTSSVRRSPPQRSYSCSGGPLGSSEWQQRAGGALFRSQRETRLSPSNSRWEGDCYSRPSPFKDSEGRAAGMDNDELSPDRQAGTTSASRNRRTTGDGEGTRANGSRRFTEDGRDEGISASYPSRRITGNGDGDGLRTSRRFTGDGQGEVDRTGLVGSRSGVFGGWDEGDVQQGGRSRRETGNGDGLVQQGIRSRRETGNGEGLVRQGSRSRRETGDWEGLGGRFTCSRRQTGEGVGEVGGNSRSRRETGELGVDEEGRRAGGHAQATGQEGRTLKRSSTSTRKRDAAMPHSYAPGDDIEKPRRSPAVVAALSGRTMLRQVSLPGRHFQRSIPSMNSRSSLVGVLEEDGQASD